MAGGSGLVGGLLLQELLRAPEYSQVTALVRRPLALEHAKLRQAVVDFDRLDASADALAADDAFCCLGTTRAKAGSAEAFRRVDLGAVLAFARAAQAAGCRRFLLVSSSGADARSRFLYPRVKGEAEDAVARLPFSAVFVLRPSLLLGPRAERRPLEALAQAALPPVARLLPARWRPIQAATVARALVRCALAGEAGVRRLENEAIQELGR